MTAPWTLWYGGPWTDSPATVVDYRMRCGITLTAGAPASELRWEHIGAGGDIVAYRVHEALDTPVK